MADSTDIESDGSNIEMELNNDLDTNTSDLNEPGYKCEQRNDGEWFRVFFNPLAKVMTTLKDSMQNGRLQTSMAEMNEIIAKLVVHKLLDQFIAF
ncbi:hypothetical protein DPMN_040827 [Dreissena polymorpha]|uniref:Uncharacterized protein n=1 Tax=Dreissena polymorpha TaxID=45954 RepID=A0A9D4CW33_DREPO|nr:hypothetical protein DPMN_040827 [Dreissena polymorpha]